MFPINLYYPLNESHSYLCIVYILFPTSVHVLLAQCFSLINKYSGKPESGNYILRFSSFHLLRYCYVSLVVELEGEQIKSVL